MKNLQKVEVDFNGEKVSFKTGHLAFRADSALEVQVGETVLLAIVTVDPLESSLDYFPLTVEYIEKFYAGGVISGSRFIKRERYPSDDAILRARQVDHSIRSLFPKGFKHAVCVVLTVLSYDGEHNPDDLSVTAASMALMLSSVPFDGPSAALKVAMDKEGKLFLNPAGEESDLKAKFVLSFFEDRILNIEGFGDEISEAQMDEIIDYGAKHIRPLLEVQKEFQKKAGKEKLIFDQMSVSPELLSKVDEKYTERITEALYDKLERKEALAEIKDEIVGGALGEISKIDTDAAVEHIARKIMRGNILEKEKRISGRKLEEIREIDFQVSYLPRVHGSAMFTRGLTQTLSIVTLGSTRLSQMLENFEGESEKRFMHHYNGPNYSFGEAGKFIYMPGRREIGHGHITENAFFKLLPKEEDFPYTIRVVSEILSQNGSSSMAAATATSLALMDAGVPIRAAVAGIAVGLITDESDTTKYKLLMDMEDIEDFYGDMDFKVVGTKKGITAIQLDNKIKGVPIDIIKEALKWTRDGRLKILEKANEILDKPRTEVSKYAPKVITIVIDKSKIGDLIGPGGKNIKNIIEESGEVDIDIQDDGTVNITAISDRARDKAKAMIEAITKEAEVGKQYEGVIDRITDFGVFVKVSPGISGLVRVSEMSDDYIKSPSDCVKVGDKVKVKVIGIDDLGRINMSMKNLIEPPKIGKIYDGVVEKVTGYGAIVKLEQGSSGLVHISEMADGFISDPNTIVKEGDKTKVKVIGIDDKGRTQLSIKRAK